LPRICWERDGENGGEKEGEMRREGGREERRGDISIN
jgi:hypothetical protein